MLANKRILIVGIANERSIATAIARMASRQDARLALTYQNAAICKRAQPIAEAVRAELFKPLDFNDVGTLVDFVDNLSRKWERIDGIVHAVAFASKSALASRYVDVSSADFSEAMRISCYSFTQILNHCYPLLAPNASIITMTSYGSEKVLYGYGLMGVAKAALECSVRYLASDLGADGIRVNAISAGPVKTLSSAAVPGFASIMRWNAEQSLLRRNVTADEIAAAATYLLSDLSAGITGEVLHIDSGHHAQGMCFM